MIQELKFRTMLKLPTNLSISSSNFFTLSSFSSSSAMQTFLAYFPDPIWVSSGCSVILARFRLAALCLSESAVLPPPKILRCWSAFYLFISYWRLLGPFYIILSSSKGDIRCEEPTRDYFSLEVLVSFESRSSAIYILPFSLSLLPLE